MSIRAHRRMGHEKSSVQNLEHAISLGKEWMERSKDPTHDVIHIENVEKAALGVYQELQQKNYPGIDEITKELVQVTVWWHDCYKAQEGKFSLYANFNEGKESVRILKREVGHLLSRVDLKLVAEAVENHAGMSLFPYFLLNMTKSPLHRILLEADSYDLIDLKRLRHHQASPKSLLEKIWGIVDLGESLILPFYLRTDYTREDLWKRLVDYWGAWLWREKYLFRAFIPGKSPLPERI